MRNSFYRKCWQGSDTITVCMCKLLTINCTMLGTSCAHESIPLIMENECDDDDDDDDANSLLLLLIQVFWCSCDQIVNVDLYI
jgi:hypothetical protein